MDELQKEILEIINTELLPKKIEMGINTPFYAEYAAGKIAEMVVKKFSSNLPVIGSGMVVTCGIHQLPMHLNRIGQYECPQCHCR